MTDTYCAGKKQVSAYVQGCLPQVGLQQELSGTRGCAHLTAWRMPRERECYRSRPPQRHVQPFSTPGVDTRLTEHSKGKGGGYQFSCNPGPGHRRTRLLCAGFPRLTTSSVPLVPCRVLTGQGEPPALGEDHGWVCRGMLPTHPLRTSRRGSGRRGELLCTTQPCPRRSLSSWGCRALCKGRETSEKGAF